MQTSIYQSLVHGVCITRPARYIRMLKQKFLTLNYDTISTINIIHFYGPQGHLYDCFPRVLMYIKYNFIIIIMFVSHMC